MIRIKSVTDVVTNSSTEVFVVKVDDFKELLEEMPEAEDYSSWTPDFETFWKKYCNEKLPRVHPAFGVTKKWQFLDLPVVKRALEMFDVSEEEITKKKIELVQEWRESSEAWYKKDKAKETEVKVEFDLHGNKADKMKEWLEKHGKQFTHRIS